MRPRALFGLLALVAALPGAPALPSGAPDPERAKRQLRVEEAWQVPLDAALAGAPIAREGWIVLPLESALEARAAETGERAWRLEALAGALASEEGLIRVDGRLRLGLALRGAEPRFVVVDVARGAAIVETSLPHAPIRAPRRVPAGARAVEGGWLVAAEEGRVLALDARGALDETHELERELGGPPALVLGVPLAWRGDPPRLVTLNGTRAGRHVRSPRPDAAAAEGRWLAAPGEGSTLTAWRCKERRGERLRCRRRWIQKLAGRVTGRPLVGEERIVTGALDTYVYAFRPRNGHLLWRTSVGHRIGKAPLAWDDYVAVVGEGRAEIVFLDALDGRLVGRVDGGSASRSETCTTRPARAGSLLVAPILETPGSGPTLKAWRVAFEAPPPPETPDAPGDPGVEPADESSEVP